VPVVVLFAPVRTGPSALQSSAGSDSRLAFFASPAASRGGTPRLSASGPGDPPNGGGSNGGGGWGGGGGDNGDGGAFSIFKPFSKNATSSSAPSKKFSGKVNEPGEVVIVRSPEDPKEFTIYCELIVGHPVDKVMDLLTDYDHLAEYIPDMTMSYRLAPTENGVTKVFQQGTEKVLGIKFKVGMNLRMEEIHDGASKILKFALTESPVMQKTFGSTTLTPIDGGKRTHFKYQITIRPKGYLPVGAPLENRMKAAVPERLVATAKGVELKAAREAEEASADKPSVFSPSGKGNPQSRRIFSRLWHRKDDEGLAYVA